jgi:integrase
MSKVNSGTVKHLVTAMADAGLAPKTIKTYYQLTKTIMGSFVNEETDEPLFPRKWNPAVVDLPIVENQKQPCFRKSEIQKMLSNSGGWERMLYIILASTGLRIGEALALEVKHVLNGGRTLRIEQQVNRFGAVTPLLKTKAGGREVDLAPDVVGLLKLYVTGRGGLLFPTRNGTARHPGNTQRELEKHTVNGFHAFRRFRNTHLRYMNCQPDILIFWMGHKPESMSELYSKLAFMRRERFAEAERCGLGFRIAASHRQQLADEEEEREQEVS